MAIILIVASLGFVLLLNQFSNHKNNLKELREGWMELKNGKR
jgi:hypothetical protein